MKYASVQQPRHETASLAVATSLAVTTSLADQVLRGRASERPSGSGRRRAPLLPVARTIRAASQPSLPAASEARCTGHLFCVEVTSFKYRRVVRKKKSPKMSPKMSQKKNVIVRK